MFIDMLLLEHTLLMYFMRAALTGFLASAWKVHHISSKVENLEERKRVTLQFMCLFIRQLVMI